MAPFYVLGGAVADVGAARLAGGVGVGGWACAALRDGVGGGEGEEGCCGGKEGGDGWVHDGWMDGGWGFGVGQDYCMRGDYKRVFFVRCEFQ